MHLQLPYGVGSIPWDAPPERVILSRIDAFRPTNSGRELVADAVANPIGVPSLASLAAGKRTATILISDHTRPVPSQDILPPLLAELRRGNPDIDVTLLVATGCHRGTTPEELAQKLGSGILHREKIVVHDAFDPKSNVEIGILPSGAPLVIDRLAAETDLLVAEGFIEPHFFAGFSGGRKSVLPGVCDRITVLGNHCGAFIDSPMARTGILDGNPIHRDMEAAARMARLQFIANVVLDDRQQTVAAFAGDWRAAHAAGVDFLRAYCQVDAVPGDVVVTTNGGAPLDQNLYQCVKGLTAAEASANPGAVLILCAELADGIGGEGFCRALKGCRDPAALARQYAATPQANTAPDQWQVQILCRILAKHRIIFVTRPEMAQPIREMKMEYAADLGEALSMAGKGQVTYIPNGVSVIVREQRDVQLNDIMHTAT